MDPVGDSWQAPDSSSLSPKYFFACLIRRENAKALPGLCRLCSLAHQSPRLLTEDWTIVTMKGARGGEHSIVVLAEKWEARESEKGEQWGNLSVNSAWTSDLILLSSLGRGDATAGSATMRGSSLGGGGDATSDVQDGEHWPFSAEIQLQLG